MLKKEISVSCEKRRKFQTSEKERREENLYIHKNNKSVYTLFDSYRDNRKSSYKVIDLFCGCGGFSYGFDYFDEHFELTYALDSWEVACRSYKANYPYVDVDCRNALEIKPSEIPRADIIIGGPPCTEFSIAKAEKRTFDVTLVEWFLKVIERIKPKFWIMENVPPLIHVLPRIVHIPKIRIYRMCDYGVPQIRKRLFCGKFNEPRKNQINFFFPAVTATEYRGSAGKRNARLFRVFKRKSLIHECKLVQTFPLDYIVYGNLREQYIQIGNAVPPFFSVKLAEALIRKSVVLEDFLWPSGEARS